ncbi:MAG TPA: host nuclease inhibitor protein [Pseudoxanthomonas sp.]|nr:host nuclease inhibitor protein [Pseudoxanthomonas sp.]
MITYCWASGLIEFGRRVPEGAIEVAHGPKVQLQKAIDVVARHGKGASAGALLVPGVPEAETEEEKGDALAAWLRWCATGSRGVQFNTVREP